VAAQDQAMSTNYVKNKILKEDIYGKSPLCQQREETIDYLTAGCPILANNEYLIRHNKVGAHLHYSVCKDLGNEMIEKLYTHTQTSMCTR
jgi:hypothetical protein